MIIIMKCTCNSKIIIFLVKQIIDTFATTQSNAFKEVVLIEYPQKDIYALEDQNQVNELLPDVNSKLLSFKPSKIHLFGERIPRAR